jgi:hypothetical protein
LDEYGGLAVQVRKESPHFCLKKGPKRANGRNPAQPSPYLSS